MLLLRSEKNPIITPSNNWWESVATFNPGAALLGNETILLYRAIGGDSLSRFGLAKSKDSVNFERLPDPVLESDLNDPYERLGIEDPRISKIDDLYYIVYTAPSVYSAQTFRERKFAPSLSHSAPWRVRPSLLTSRDFVSFERHGILLDRDSKDACLLPEKVNNLFVLYHRVYPDVYISYSEDLKTWQDEKVIFSPREGYWDSERVGMGSPPIKTEKGWLSFYHAVDKDHTYQIGVVVFSLSNPAEVLFRSDKPVFSPETAYERQGFVPNVVFTCGVVETAREFFVYYGAADKVIGLAKINKEELFSEVKK